MQMQCVTAVDCVEKNPLILFMSQSHSWVAAFMKLWMKHLCSSRRGITESHGFCFVFLLQTPRTVSHKGMKRSGRTPFSHEEMDEGETNRQEDEWEEEGERTLKVCNIDHIKNDMFEKVITFSLFFLIHTTLLLTQICIFKDSNRGLIKVAQLNIVTHWSVTEIWYTCKWFDY